MGQAQDQRIALNQLRYAALRINSRIMYEDSISLICGKELIAKNGVHRGVCTLPLYHSQYGGAGGRNRHCNGSCSKCGRFMVENGGSQHWKLCLFCLAARRAASQKVQRLHHWTGEIYGFVHRRCNLECENDAYDRLFVENRRLRDELQVATAGNLCIA